MSSSLNTIPHVGAEAATQSEINRHLEMGRQYLASNQLADALTHYHAAVGENLLIRHAPETQI